MFNTQEVDQAIRNLKLSKAAGDYNISTEYVIYVHLIVVLLQRDLFHLSML